MGIKTCEKEKKINFIVNKRLREAKVKFLIEHDKKEFRQCIIKLQLHDAIYRLRFYSNSLIHILSLSNSHNNVASLQKNRGGKSHRVIVALQCKLKKLPI